MNKRCNPTPLFCTVLVAGLLGCSAWEQHNVVTGHFLLRTASGIIRLRLMPNQKMQEFIIPRYGTSRDVEGTWTIKGSYIVLTPFGDWGNGSSVLIHPQCRASAQYDHHGNVQALRFVDDGGITLIREHPLTLSKSCNRAWWNSSVVGQVGDNSCLTG